MVNLLNIGTEEGRSILALVPFVVLEVPRDQDSFFDGDRTIAICAPRWLASIAVIYVLLPSVAQVCNLCFCGLWAVTCGLVYLI